MADLQATIESLWANRDQLAVNDADANRHVLEAVTLLDRGEARVAEIASDGSVVVHEWLKLAILLYFRQSEMATIELGPFEYADKIPLKHDFQAAGVRVVPGASARFGSFLDRGAVMMPSYVNIGARVGANSMVDTWATVGSCAQIGANVHLGGRRGHRRCARATAGRAGDHRGRLHDLQPLHRGGRRPGRAGARCSAPGCILSSTIPVIDVETGEELARGSVPPWSVAVSATRPRQFPGGEFGLPCVASSSG